MNKIQLIAPLLAAPVLAGVVVLKDTGAPPHAVVIECAQAARSNDLATLFKTVLTKEEYAELAAEWDAERTREPDPAEVMGFNVAVQMFLVDGAEEALFQQLEPQLAEFEEQAAFFGPAIVDTAESQLEKNAELTDEQRADARVVLDNIGSLFGEAGLADRQKARTAIGMLCEGVRGTGIESYEEMCALDLEQLLEHAGPLFGAVKGVLALYDLDVDAWLDSVDARTIQEDGTSARVRVSYEMFGTTHDTEAEFVKRDGRWVGKR